MDLHPCSPCCQFSPPSSPDVWFFFFLIDLCFLTPVFHSATGISITRGVTSSGRRDLQQPKHLLPVKFLGFSLSREASNCVPTFLTLNRGGKRKKKKKHDYTRTSFISVHSRQKEKKTIQEQDVPSLKALSPLPPLHCHLFPFTTRNCIEFVFSIRKLNLPV